MHRRNVRLVLGVLMGTLAQLAAIGLLLASAWLIVRAAEKPPVLYLMVAIVSVRFFGIARSVLRYVERLLTHDVAFRDEIAQRIEVYRDLDRIAPWGITGSRRGDLISRAISDTAAMSDRLLRLRLPWWIGLAAVATVVGVVGALDWRCGVIIAVMAGITAAGIRLLVANLARGRRQRSAQVTGELSAQVSELALAAPELVAHGLGESSTQRGRRAATELSSLQMGGAQAAGLGSGLVLLAVGAAITVLAMLSVDVDPVLVGVMLLAPIGLAEPMETWSDAERVRPGVDAAAGRLEELSGLPAPWPDPLTPHNSPASSKLCIEGLVVGWETPLIGPIDMIVEPGDVVGVSGPSGIGKSTLALTVTRMLKPHGGSVTLGGIDIGELSTADVLSRIGLLNQDEVIFDTSIRENLRIADPDMDDQAMMAVLAAAGLDGFVAALPDGLDTPTGEGGARLSGGERQRLALARLLAGQHEILIFDEPTEHLDAQTAHELLEDLLALAPERSLVIISHSPDVIGRVSKHIRVG